MLFVQSKAWGTPRPTVSTPFLCLPPFHHHCSSRAPRLLSVWLLETLTVTHVLYRQTRTHRIASRTSGTIRKKSASWCWTFSTCSKIKHIGFIFGKLIKIWDFSLSTRCWMVHWQVILLRMSYFQFYVSNPVLTSCEKLKFFPFFWITTGF